MNNKTSFGLYFGNTSCCIAVNRNEKIEVVANAVGDRVTPVVVGFYEGNEVVAGTSAKQALVRDSNSSIVGVLRVIGSSSKDNIIFPLNQKCKLTFDSGKPRFIVQNADKNRVILPEEVVKHIFILLKDIAASYSEDALPVVICVPAWATDEAIFVLKEVATLTGFQVLTIIKHPAAACLSNHLLDGNFDNLNIALVHCGGSSTVASIADITGGLLSIKETCTSTVAGDSLTAVLVDHLAKEFYMKYKGNPLENKRSRRKLFSESEKSKHILSTMNLAQVYVESLWEGVDFSTQLSRARFDGIVSSTLNEILLPLKEVLSRTGTNKGEIHKVILTGGSCKIPKLKEMISDTFPNATIMQNYTADEALAIGAAMESKYVLGKSYGIHAANNTLFSCLSNSIYAKILENGEDFCIFSCGSPTHSRKQLTLECPSYPCTLVIYEIDTQDNQIEGDNNLAEVHLNFNSSVRINLNLDCTLKNDGSLLVKLREPIHDLTKSFLIEANK